MYVIKSNTKNHCDYSIFLCLTCFSYKKEIYCTDDFVL